MSKKRKSKIRAGGVATGWLKLRITPELKERIRVHTASRDQDMSEWIRRTLQQRIDQEATYRSILPLQIDPRDLAQAPVFLSEEETDEQG